MRRPPQSGTRWVPPARHTLQLKVTLQYIRPPIWRRVVVPDNLTLGDLHDIIQLAMGWTNSHLHAFKIGPTTYGVNSAEAAFGPEEIDETSVRLGKVIRHKSQRFTYDYDFGDGWRHEILVEKIEAAATPPPPPRCVAGKRACPPEDCGGPPGYGQILRALQQGSAAGDPELLEWVGDYDPEEFDAAVVDRLLGRK